MESIYKQQETSKITTWQSTEYDPEEVFVPIIYEGIDYSPYAISKEGNVVGYRYADTERKILKKLQWSMQSESRARYLSVTLRVDPLAIADQEYKPQQKQSLKHNGKINKTVYVHRLVAEMFIPKPIPKMFESIWLILSQEQKNWIHSSYVVDYIDDDPGNPHIDNLRWVTVKENNSYYKKQKQKNSS